MSRVLLALPIRDVNGGPGWKTEKCINALRASTKHAVEVFLARGQQITQNSLSICVKALSENWDYVLYTGDDITFPPWALDQLIARDADVIAGVCTYKTPPYYTTGMVADSVAGYKKLLVTRTHVQQKAVIEVDAVGSGFMLIKRGTLEAIDDFLRYKVYPSMPAEYRWMCPVPYFPVTFNPDNNTLTGSDYSFCKLAKMVGKKIYMDCGLICGHRWEKDYDIEDHWNWVEKEGWGVDELEYPGQMREKIPIPTDNIYWGDLGAPVPITVTTAGSEYHTFEYIVPTLACAFEPLDNPSREVATKVGYIVGLHLSEKYGFDEYMTWARRFEKCLIHWVGSDAMIAKERLTPQQWEVLRQPMFVHLVQHERLNQDIIEQVGETAKVVIPAGKQFSVAPLPENFTVFVYYPKHRHDFHYGDVLKEVIEKMPDVSFRLCHLFGEAPDFQYPNMVWMGNLQGAEYARALARSSAVLRLSMHEGNPLTIAEAGIMGRRFVTNFDMEHTVRVSDLPTADEVVAALRSIQGAKDPDLEIAATYRKIHNRRDYRDAIESLAGVGGQMQVMNDEMAKAPYDYRKYFEFRYGQGARGAGGPDPRSGEVKWTTKQIAKLISDYGCEKVLDIGCGSMVRWKKLPVDPENYTGVDISDTALRFAQEKFPEATFFTADVTKDALPITDAVISIDMMQHIKPADFERVVRKLFYAAKKLLVVKTSINFTPGFYQFSHKWNGAPIDGWKKVAEQQVPECAVSRLLVFAKQGEPAVVDREVVPVG
jgi:SAM-dependent methyltransferase